MKPAPNEHPENTQAAPTDTQNTQDHVDSGSVQKLPDRPDRPSPYYVGWKIDGERKKMGFKNAKDRDEKFRELEKAAKRGTLDLVPTRDDLRDWQAFKRATHPTRWQDVVAGWRESGQFSCTTTVAAAVDAFIKGREKRVKEGTINESTVAHQRTDMRRFKDSFGSMKLDEPTAEQIEEWLDDLAPNSNATFNSKLKVVRSFFNGLVDQGLVRESPAASILLRDGSIGEVGINTVAEMAQLFAYAKEHHPEALGRLALEAFAGLRFSSLPAAV